METISINKLQTPEKEHVYVIERDDVDIEVIENKADTDSIELYDDDESPISESKNITDQNIDIIKERSIRNGHFLFKQVKETDEENIRKALVAQVDFKIDSTKLTKYIQECKDWNPPE